MVDDRKTHVDIGDPSESTDHGRFRDGIASVKDETKKQNTSDRLRGCWRAERSGYGTEPSLHRQSHSEHKHEESAGCKTSESWLIAP